MRLTLVLGGARSGKTAYALREAEAAASAPGAIPVFIATAQAWDDEMAARIARHRDERGDRWRTVDAPLELTQALRALGPGEVAVVDCLTLWLTNVMLAERDLAEARAELVAAVGQATARLFLVSNEVGLGIVPDNALARRFRDEAGWLHQALAAVADEVILTAAGLPLRLKPQSP
ncbi:MAG: bifunctional adenosylcobinamide kinase/adenosylcobinamide-phosphate guanylyltransferase [Pseudomonadota bacterium]